MSHFPKVPNMLPPNRPLRLAVIITIVGIIAYAMGALMHSEIWHFFMDALEDVAGG